MKYSTNIAYIGYYFTETDYFHADNIQKPAIAKGKSYEVNEMRTYIGKKSRLRWIVYALDRESKTVVSFNVGWRTNKTLKRVIQSLELSGARRIYTDKLKNHRYLIVKKLHNTLVHSTNHIERYNLSIRTHLKRLNRKTICFSRSLVIFMAVLRIYFWSWTNFDLFCAQGNRSNISSNQSYLY